MWDEAGVRVLVCMQAAAFEVFWDDFVEAWGGLEVVGGGGGYGTVKTAACMDVNSFSIRLCLNTGYNSLFQPCIFLE